MSDRKDYYQRNREKIKARSRKWLSENRERALKTKALYRNKNAKDLAAKQLARHYANKNNPEYQSKRAAYREKIRVKARIWSQQRASELTDGYVREMLSKYSHVSSNHWPKELVEAKRAEMMCMRMTGDKRYKPCSIQTR